MVPGDRTRGWHTHCVPTQGRPCDILDGNLQGTSVDLYQKAPAWAREGAAV